MIVKMHFSTFMKILAMNPGDKIRHISKYEQPGGYDYYISSRKGVRDYCLNLKTKEQVIRMIESSPNSSERNLEIFDSMETWKKKNRGLYSKPYKGIWRSPNKFFGVHIEPEIAYHAGDIQHVVAVYPSKNERINRDQAGAGILLLQKGYKGTGKEKFGIYDVEANKTHRAQTNISARLLENEIEFIENELKRIKA